MGAYLSQPNTQKESQDDSTDQISYGASSMQGWRLEQEDAHTCLLNFDERTRSSLFAVYDGHGGAEVAQYCAKHLPTYLQAHLDEFRDGGDLKQALRQLFLRIDEILKSDEAQRELKEMRDGSQAAHEQTIQNDPQEDGDEEDDDEANEGGDGGGGEEKKKSETELLYDEATMPIEEVLKRYKKSETRTKRALEKAAAKQQQQPEKSQQPQACGSGSGSHHDHNQQDETKSSTTTTTTTSDTKKPPLKTSDDFQKQEEIDMDEIKKNSMKDAVNNSSNNHEQDFDEASNLDEVTESQQKQASAAKVNDENKPSNDDHEEKKPKLNKEELKLSPIRKKSLSSSSLVEDVERTPKSNEEKQEKARASSSNLDVETDETSGSKTNNNNNNNNSNNNHSRTQQLQALKTLHKSSNLIAKFIADCVNTKLKAANKLKSNKEGTGKKATKKGTKSKRNGTEGEESNGGENEQEEASEEAEEEGENGGGGDDDEEENVDGEKEEGDEEDSESDDDEEDDDDEDDDDDDDEDDDDEDDDEDEDDDDEEDDEEDEDDDDDEEDEEDEDAEFVGAQPRPGYDSGCTAVVALLVGQKHLYVANAGDSRCVVCRDGKAIDMSEDHKPEDEHERARIEKAGGTISKDGRVNNGLNLSRAIGDHLYKANESLPLSEQMISSAPDVKYVELDPLKDQFMVLACDGIWNFMSSQEVCDYVSERLNANYSKLSQICEELFMHCLAPNSDGDGTGCDNMTCIIVTFRPFRSATIKVPSPAAAITAGLKRSHENGKESNGNGEDKSTDSSQQKQPAEEEVTNISKKLKQDGDELPVTAETRAS